MPPVSEWLSSAETSFYTDLKTDKRRHDWLLGRWTAKALLTHVVAAQTSARPDLRCMTVSKTPDGSPQIETATADNWPALTLSISHSHGVAAAALVTEAGWPLGIDLEWIEARHLAFAADYFTMDEQKQLVTVSDDFKPVAVNAIWSGKEACLKAVRLGLTQDTRAVSCDFDFKAMEPAGWSAFDIIWDRTRLPSELPELLGWWRVIDGFVLTVAGKARPQPTSSISSPG